MSNVFARHGDLIFLYTDELPSEKCQREMIVAHGENGHNHVLIAQTDSVILGDNTLFTVKGKAKLVHQEHNEIEFESGTYLVIREREHDYVEETAKEVRD